LLLYVITIGPFFEECIFRLILRPTKQNTLFFGVSICTYMIFRYILGSTLFVPFIIILGIYLSLLVLSKLTFNPIKWIIGNYWLFFYLNCLCFGLLHILNFGRITLPLLVLAPLITLPQTFIGMACGYLRMNYGFLYGLIFHIAVNFFGAILSFHEICTRI
jgi:uncharacterized protein